MQTRSLIRLCAGLSLVIVASMSRGAEAHYILNAPTSWWTQTGDGSPQKGVPCGNEGAANTAASGTVNVFQPGQPVTITATSTIPHPGWWRISLREGRVSGQTAALFPDPTPMGAAGSALQCTPAFVNNPVWSTTQPVLVDKLGIPPATPNSTTTVQNNLQTTVTIPASARCSSAAPCTLQVLMIMTDHPAGSCNYHHCADMAAAGSTGDAGVVVDAGSGTGGRTGTGGTPGGTGGRAGTGGDNGGGNGAGGASGTGGAPGGSGGAIAGLGGSTGTTGTGGGNGVGGAVDAGNINTETPSDSGCSCAVGAGASTGGWTAAGLLVVGLLLRRRRRR